MRIRDYMFASSIRNSVAAYFIVLLCLFGVFSHSVIAAGGGVGSGGDATGGTGGYQSTSGYGWYLYDVTSSGPNDGFRDGTKWSKVQATCAGYSDKVAVFIIQNSLKNPTKFKGYNYVGWNNPKYYQKGKGFIDVKTAQQGYNDLPSSMKNGFTWATNVAWYCYGVKKATSWDATGKSYVNGVEGTIDASPGETVKFTHRIKNVGNASVSNLNWKTGEVTGPSSGSVSLGVGESKYLPSQGEDYKVPPDAVSGSIYCQYISFRNSQSNSATENSAKACVKVKSNYDLYPKVIMPNTVIPSGAEQTVTETIINNAQTADRQSPYAVYEFTIARGQVKPTPADVDATFNITKDVRSQTVQYVEASVQGSACDWVKANAQGFRVMSPGCKLLSNGTRLFNRDDNLIADLPILADDYKIGDMICRIVAIGYFRYDTTNANLRRISKPVCVTVAKAPYVQVWGNDIRVGDAIYGIGKANGPRDNASIYTQFRKVGADTYGSWAEYGIFAPSSGVIRSVSGGAIAMAPAKPLSFANTTTPDSGHWGPAKVITSIIDKLPAMPQGKEVVDTLDISEDLNSGLTDGQWYKVTGKGSSITIKDLTGAGYNASKGTVVIDMTAGDGAKTIVIDQDIKLNRPNDVAYSRLGGASQIIIVVKGNIIINSNVSRIDAWLVALPSTDSSDDGIISTCDEIAKPPKKYYNGLIVSGPCNQKQLVINGAVMAKQIQLRRTFGAEQSAYGQPAEIINLRADAYMWGYGLAGGSDGTGYPIRTIKTRELPPRF